MTSGFMFTTKYPLARFKQLRSEGWDQYLHFISWGMLFSFVSFLATWGIYCCGDLDKILSNNCIWICDKSGVNSVYIIIWSILNILFAFGIGMYLSQNEKCVTKATLLCAKENQLKYRIYESVESGHFVQITLVNNKVYIGYIETFMELNSPDAKYIKICPFFSGYRTPKRRILRITNNYCKRFPLEVFNSYSDENSMKKTIDEILEPYTIVLPIKDIVTLGFFDPDFYESVNDNKKKHRKKATI